MYKNYSINFMWINKFTQPIEQEYLVHNKYFFEAPYNIGATVMYWSIKEPTAKLNFWYDSNTVNAQQIKNTLELFSAVPINNIFFKDLKDIPIVKSNPDLFSSTIPLYWRIDLLKLIIILDEIEREKQDCACFVDFKEKFRNPTAKLFNKNIEIMLQRYGMLLAKGRENQFHQLVPNPYMQIALKHFINMHFHAITTILNSPKSKWFSSTDFINFEINLYFAELFYKKLDQVIHSSLHILYNLYFSIATAKPILFKDPISLENFNKIYNFSNYEPIAFYLSPIHPNLQFMVLSKDNDRVVIFGRKNLPVYPLDLEGLNPSRYDIGRTSLTHEIKDPMPILATPIDCTFYPIPDHQTLAPFILGTPEQIMLDLRILAIPGEFISDLPRDYEDAPEFEEKLHTLLKKPYARYDLQQLHLAKQLLQTDPNVAATGSLIQFNNQIRKLNSIISSAATISSPEISKDVKYSCTIL